MRLEANTLVEEASSALGISLADLIALASVWVSPEIVRLLEPCEGVWYPDRRRANLGLRIEGKMVENVGQVTDGVTLDNNTYANFAFKRALGVDRSEFVGFHGCHIWPGTACDAGCYTNIANLVAIPAELSSLTDHHPHIVACLKYRAWELYRWKPAKELAPVRPEGYPTRWRDAWPMNEAARRAVARRVGAGRDGAGEADAVVRVAEPATMPVGPRLHLSGDASTAAAIEVAFYLSKFDHQRLAIGNQGETIDHAATRLGVKRNTLKNYRDYFDSHTGSQREGWKLPLPPQLASPFPTLMRMSEPELREKVLQWIR